MTVLETISRVCTRIRGIMRRPRSSSPLRILRQPPAQGARAPSPPAMAINEPPPVYSEANHELETQSTIRAQTLIIAEKQRLIQELQNKYATLHCKQFGTLLECFEKQKQIVRTKKELDAAIEEKEKLQAKTFEIAMEKEKKEEEVVGLKKSVQRHIRDKDELQQTIDGLNEVIEHLSEMVTPFVDI
ncbi:hypothetical protein L596_005536 [Steinernema carpocapsae]|uniref:Transforming acidic coiled-coil-containing protein C-terminal domain-containing protein n=1 Tax=Steinernema carpocapsae TaxID=34508 RepID=A0A4U8V0I6_STECR|nr:hypothetical protein L596_005536 [Steinernema carpocapsae]